MAVETTEALQGDTADMIARRVYGAESGFVEPLLAANPGLAALGPILPMGTLVVLPEIERAAKASLPVITLWD